LALIENIHREDMSALDKARAVAKLIKNTKLEQQEVAQAIGVAPAYVSQYLALLELPEDVQDALRDGTISFTHARSLCRLLPNTDLIASMLNEALTLTVSALDAKVSHAAALMRKEEDAAEAAGAGEGADGEDKPKKARKPKAPPAADKAVEYYTDADFHPLKKDEIRELMITFKRKELNADTAKKREEYRLILKGITLAADLRLK
jgi:ParB-like chromosome segregation protein Spo0J